jgi:serine/threonine protein kinase HipA of HipAB toxin-antitoxin module
VSLPARETVYPERAAAALLGEAPGSSAGGEFAKFTAVLAAPAGVQHVIVKFSPADDSAASVRWRDLLIAEHHAPEALSGLGVAAAVSSVLICAHRVFLEVPRFDRLGAHGRHAVVTLAAIEAAPIGSGQPRWEAAAADLHRHGWLTDEDLARVRVLGLFGDCIGNTDMHAGNLAFLQSSPGALALAPAYDMLPMMFAPNRTGEIVARSLPVRPPAPGMEAPWRQALGAALGYWSRLSDDDRISEDFRRVCDASKQQLEALGERFG